MKFDLEYKLKVLSRKYRITTSIATDNTHGLQYCVTIYAHSLENDNPNAVYEFSTQWKYELDEALEDVFTKLEDVILLHEQKHYTIPATHIQFIGIHHEPHCCYVICSVSGLSFKEVLVPSKDIPLELQNEILNYGYAKADVTVDNNTITLSNFFKSDIKGG